jgi:hypothetical protein
MARTVERLRGLAGECLDEHPLVRRKATLLLPRDDEQSVRAAARDERDEENRPLTRLHHRLANGRELVSETVLAFHVHGFPPTDCATHGRIAVALECEERRDAVLRDLAVFTRMERARYPPLAHAGEDHSRGIHGLAHLLDHDPRDIRRGECVRQERGHPLQQLGTKPRALFLRPDSATLECLGTQRDHGLEPLPLGSAQSAWLAQRDV